MSREEKIALLQRWIHAGKRLNDVYGNLAAMFRISPENEITQSAWDAFGAYTDALACLLADDGQWLEWFAYELDFGAKAAEVTLYLEDSPDEGETFLVRTAEDLLRAIGH